VAKARQKPAGLVAPGLELQESSSQAATVVLAPLILFALLLFAAAAISPAYVPWPRVAFGLHAHRADLLVGGFGIAGVAFALFFLQQIGL
jgi:hypothetical protein